MSYKSDKKANKPYYKKWWFWSISLLVIIVIAYASYNQQSKEANPNDAVPPGSVGSDPSNEAYGTLGIMPHEFQDHFNVAAEDINSTFRIEKLEVAEGEGNHVFNYSFTNQIALLGTVNKTDGSIRSMLLIGDDDDTLQEGTNIISTIGILISATNPAITSNERDDVMKELGLNGQEMDLSSIDTQTVKNDVIYRLQSVPILGVMFSVGDVKAEN